MSRIRSAGGGSWWHAATCCGCCRAQTAAAARWFRGHARLLYRCDRRQLLLPRCDALPRDRNLTLQLVESARALNDAALVRLLPRSAGASALIDQLSERGTGTALLCDSVSGRGFERS